jgi:hypothetical protein
MSMISLSPTLRPFGYLAIGAVSACLLGDLLGRPASAQTAQATLEARIAQLEASSRSMQNQWASLQTQQQELRAHWTAMNKITLAQITVADWKNVTDQLKALAASIAALQKNVAQLQTGLTQAQTTDSSLAGQLARINDQVSQLANALTALQTKFANHSHSILFTSDKDASGREFLMKWWKTCGPGGCGFAPEVRVDTDPPK